MSDSRRPRFALGQNIAAGSHNTTCGNDEDALQAFHNLLERLRKRGTSLIEPPEDPALEAVTGRLDLSLDKSLDMVSYDMRWPLLGYLESHAGDIGPRIHELIKRANNLTRKDYRERLMFRAGLRERIAALRDSYDAFLLPAASGPAPEGLGYTGSRTMLVYYSFLGFPAYSVPVSRPVAEARSASDVCKYPGNQMMPTIGRGGEGTSMPQPLDLALGPAGYSGGGIAPLRSTIRR